MSFWYIYFGIYVLDQRKSERGKIITRLDAMLQSNPSPK